MLGNSIIAKARGDKITSKGINACLIAKIKSAIKIAIIAPTKAGKRRNINPLIPPAAPTAVKALKPAAPAIPPVRIKLDKLDAVTVLF